MKTNAASPSMLSCIVFSTLVALCSITITYSLLRCLQFWLFTEPDPRLFAQGSRIPMFWRLLVSAYLSALVFIGVASLYPRYSLWLCQQLPKLIVVTAVLSLVQSLFVP